MKLVHFGGNPSWEIRFEAIRREMRSTSRDRDRRIGRRRKAAASRVPAARKGAGREARDKASPAASASGTRGTVSVKATREDTAARVATETQRQSGKLERRRRALLERGGVKVLEPQGGMLKANGDSYRRILHSLPFAQPRGGRRFGCGSKFRADFSIARPCEAGCESHR